MAFFLGLVPLVSSLLLLWLGLTCADGLYPPYAVLLGRAVPSGFGDNYYLPYPQLIMLMCVCDRPATAERERTYRRRRPPPPPSLLLLLVLVVVGFGRCSCILLRSRHPPTAQETRASPTRQTRWPKWTVEGTTPSRWMCGVKRMRDGPRCVSFDRCCFDARARCGVSLSG